MIFSIKKSIMRTPSLVWILALLLSAVGIAALPHADLNEHVYGTGASASMLELAMPHLFGVGLGLLASVSITWLGWARLQRVSPWWWLAAAVAAVLLPLPFHSTVFERLGYPGGVVSLTATMPLLAAWAAAMNARLGDDRPLPGCVKSLAWIGLAVALAVLATPILPLYLLLYLPVLLAFSVPRLRLLSGAGFAVLAGAFTLFIISMPHRLDRYLAATLPLSEGDPYGFNYQASHAMLILKNTSWFGSDTLIHLPRATTQLLPVSLAEQWGGLAFVAVLVLMGVWLMLARPRKLGSNVESEFRFVFARFLWFCLLLATVSNVSVNLLLLPPHGQGMPMLTGNWGLIVMAWLLMAANGQLPSLDFGRTTRTATETNPLSGALDGVHDASA